MQGVTIEETLRADPSDTADTGSVHAAQLRAGFRRGAPIDRYTVLELLGAGGMGQVFAAYDPGLDRKVAIKLLRHTGRDFDAAQLRLRREAQALARLDHPNVVGVYDVGVYEGLVYVAMEFVAGQTLGAWLRTPEPRPWTELLPVFDQAGRGLAAAHGAGLLHRDFKPENVMLGDDGRARVMDFGLARADHSSVTTTSELEPVEPTDLSGSNPALDTNLTRTGALLGTPAYIAPELLLGTSASAASDQYALCVALYEALYGERPYTGETWEHLRTAILDGELPPPPRSARVPAWIHKIVVRGLARDPQARWPSVAALLEALAHDPALQRRRWLLGAGLVAGLATLVASVAVLVHEEPSSTPVCAFDDALDGVWDPSRRAAIESRIRASGRSHADETWTRVAKHLDTYTRQWQDMRREACEANKSGAQSDTLYDRRAACLDDRRLRLRALVDELGHAEASAVDQASKAAAELARLEPCADTDALVSAVPAPEDLETRALVAGLDERLVVAEAKLKLGAHAEALPLVEAVIVQAELLAYRPLEARAYFLLGWIQEFAGDYEAAAVNLATAYDRALEQRMMSVAADAATRLVWVHGHRLSKPETAALWAAQADPLSRPLAADLIRARLFDALGVIAFGANDYDTAAAHLEKALRLRRDALGPEHHLVAVVLQHRGNLAKAQGDYAQAQALALQATQIFTTALGADHPSTGESLNTLGNIAKRREDFATARTHLERSLAIFEATLGAEHPNIGITLHNLAGVYEELEEFDEARVARERALAILETALGLEHPTVAAILDGVARSAMLRGDTDEALRHRLRALEILETALGPNHPRTAIALDQLGLTYLERGELERARTHHQRALERLPADDPKLAGSRANFLGHLAEVSHAQGEFARGRAELERAIEMLQPVPPDIRGPLLVEMRTRMQAFDPTSPAP